MRAITTLMLIIGLGIGLGLAVPQAARADWKVIVVGQPGPGADRAFAEAFHASEGLIQAGFEELDLIRDLPRARLTDTLAALDDAPRLIVFYAGRINSGSISMQDGTMPLNTLVSSAAASGTRELVLMIENCGQSEANAAQVIAPEPVEGMEVMVIASAEPGSACAQDKKLSERLRTLSKNEAPLGDLMGQLDGLHMIGAVPTAMMMTGPPEAPAFSDDTEVLVELLPEDVILLAPLEGDFGLSGSVDDDGTAPETSPVTGPVSGPVSGPVDDVIEVLLPAQEPDLPQEVVDNEPVVTFAALPQAQLTALPLATGLPEPSILVGLIEGVTEAALGDDADGDSTALGNFIDDNAVIAASLRTLRDLRDNDPALFTQLLDSGAFDPEGTRVLAKTIQTELKTMDCYTRGIDGDFGRGSQAGARAYYDQLKKAGLEALSDPKASVELFRLVLRHDPVTCPPPPVVRRATTPSRNTASSSRSSSRSSGTSTRTTRSAPAPAPTPSAPARSAPARSSGGGGGFSGSFGGVFR